MQMCFYYCTPDGQHLKMKTINGKTEDECINKAYKELGKENIYSWCRV